MKTLFPNKIFSHEKTITFGFCENGRRSNKIDVSNSCFVSSLMLIIVSVGLIGCKDKMNLTMSFKLLELVFIVIICCTI